MTRATVDAGLPRRSVWVIVTDRRGDIWAVCTPEEAAEAGRATPPLHALVTLRGFPREAAQAVMHAAAAHARRCRVNRDKKDAEEDVR